MKKLLSLILSAVLVTAIPLIAQDRGGGVASPQQATAEQIGSFRAEMQKQLLIAQRKVTDLGKPTLGVAQAPSAIDRVSLEKAMETLDFKTSIVSSYYYSPVLGSFQMQKDILNVLKKDVVTQSDLQDLQIEANTVLSNINSGVNTAP